MNRRGLRVRLGVVLLAAVTAACLTFVVSGARADVHEAVAVLALEDAEPGIDEPFTWINRETVRLEAHGRLLVAAEGVDLDEVRSVGLGRSSRRLEVRVRASDPEVATTVAAAYARVAAADLARAGDDAVHRGLRAAELAMGLPSPPLGIRPHIDDGPGSAPPEDELASARAALTAARDAAVDALRPGVPDPVGPSVQVAPVPWRDALEAALLVGLITLVVVVGPPNRWPALRPRPHHLGDGRLLTVVLWLWLLTPLARRVVAWAGLGSGRVLLAVPAVLTLGVVPALVARRWPPARLGVVTGALAAPVVLAAGVGLLEHGPASAVLSASAWLAPALLAVWAATALDRQVALRIVTDWLALGAVVAGGYAAVQWATAPPWDTAWVESAGVRSFGDLEPFGLRAFGPLGAPATLGVFCAAALLLALWSPVRARRLAVLGAGTGLLLSLHRSSWLLFVVAVVVVAVQARPGRRRLVGAAGVVLAVVAAGALVPAVRARVADSVSAGFGDRSLGIRADLYDELLPEALLDPVGSGFGAVGVGARSATGIDPATDSTVLDVLLVFGGPVGIFVLAVLVVAMSRMRPRARAEGTAPAAWALLVGLAVVSPLVNVLEGAAGVVTWALALLAARPPDEEAVT